MLLRNYILLCENLKEMFIGLDYHISGKEPKFVIFKRQQHCCWMYSGSEAARLSHTAYVTIKTYIVMYIWTLTL